MANANDKPTEGDTYECKTCGMSILLTADCKCETADGPFFACCGQQLEKKSDSA